MKQRVWQFFLLLFTYMVFALPFKAMNLIPGFTDVRPVTALGPIYAVFWGPLGCMVCGCGNMIADIIDNALRWSSLAGFAANFLGPCVTWYMWRHYAKRSFALRTGRELLFHIGTIIVAALLETAIISPAVATAYPEVNVVFFAATLLGNTTVFPIVLGIPITILMQEELEFTPCASLRGH
ncbi:MAG: hypothetical protein IKR81_15540 [Victivallales bacterium]|nr:hypothetical protein [Victivallales bacterium]